eukprot:2124286-Prymnesium_polylepis.1
MMYDAKTIMKKDIRYARFTVPTRVSTTRLTSLRRDPRGCAERDRGAQDVEEGEERLVVSRTAQRETLERERGVFQVGFLLLLLLCDSLSATDGKANSRGSERQRVLQQQRWRQQGNR